MNKENQGESKTYVSPFTRTIIDINDLHKILKPGANHGLCGGHNLGNTCFMNSSIACLSNCTELTTYFLSGDYKQNINKSNKEGVGGKLANAWHSLLVEYWNTSSRAGNPSDVKAAVAKKVKKFSGFSQQDSNEFMTEFLSILSEDLNKTTKKDFKELEEKKDNESDIEAAKRFWNLHIKRNDSIITDLFSGLLKSIVECTNCKWKSITFDPFNTLCLAIPSREYIAEIKQTDEPISLFYIPKYNIRKSIRLNLRVKKKLPLKEIVEEFKTIENCPYKPNKLAFIQVSDQEMKRVVEENESKRVNEYVFAFDDLNERDDTDLIPLYMQKGKRYSAFPRLLFLKKNMTFLELKKKIFYYARKHLKIPMNQKTEAENALEKYLEANDLKDEEKLLTLLDNEYNDIFLNTNEGEENLKKFFEDFPYTISVSKGFKEEEYKIFDGKNISNDELKDLNIEKDESTIDALIDKIKNNDYCLILHFNTNSEFIQSKMNLDECETLESKDYKKKTSVDMSLTLDDLLEFFCSCEHLEKGNEWFCKKCKKKVSASKKFEIFYLPRLMSICLSRFHKSSHYYQKNDEFIDFPLENLDMGKYICSPEKEHNKYDLFAVSQHYGGTGGGHYTAVCKNFDGKWYNYNDSSCSQTSAGSVVSSAAYVLFYRRQNW